MKIMYGKGRKAISPVIATVILIAITLIAAIAIAGFVFGLFGSFTSTAQVTVAANSLSAAGITTGTAASPAFTCATSSSASYIELSNTGTASTTVTGVSLTYGGGTTAFALSAGGSCTTNPVTAGGTVYIILAGKSAPAASAGQQFTGSVTLANGANVPVSGTFLA